MLAGIILIIINVPLGWAGLFLFGYYGKKTGKKIYYVLSVATYVISWIMAAVGVYLCEEKYAKYIFANYIIKFIYPVMFIIIIVLIALYFYKKKYISQKQTQ